LAASVVTTNLIISAWITEPDPTAFAAVGQIRQVIDAEAIDGDAPNEALNIVGTTTISVTTADGAATFAATDSVTLTVVIETRSDVVAPAAVLSA